LALTNFIIPQRLAELQQALESNALQWNSIGPANRRHYDTLGRWGPETETGIILQTKQFLRSRVFGTFLEHLTGLSIAEAYRGEVRKFKHQDYTMIHDNQEHHSSDGLDVLLGVQGDTAWKEDDGGFVTYLDSEDELLTLIPRNNTLSLVYREQGCMQFVKFVGLTAPAPRYDFQLTFSVTTKDDEGDDYNNANEDEYQSDEYNDDAGAGADDDDAFQGAPDDDDDEDEDYA